MTHATLVVLGVVHHQGRYLIVEERDGTFYLPAGRVEPGEDLITAMLRETAEEAGTAIGLAGILGIEHSWSPDAMRLRFFFVGYPAILAPPKSRPDEHSRGARWLRKEELARLPLRHAEVLDWIERFESAPPLLPCTAYDAHGGGARR
jgi:8-oxo-dGTP pyrophosphatase MutT (NUDIX family)